MPRWMCAANGIRNKNYYVAVYGVNVANSRYRNQVQYNGFGIGAGWSAPAVWGVEFGAKF